MWGKAEFVFFFFLEQASFLYSVPFPIVSWHFVSVNYGQVYATVNRVSTSLMAVFSSALAQQSAMADHTKNGNRERPVPE